MSPKVDELERTLYERNCELDTGQQNEKISKSEVARLNNIVITMQEAQVIPQPPVLGAAVGVALDNPEDDKRVTANTLTPMRMILNRSLFVSQKLFPTPHEIAIDKRLCKMWFGTKFLPTLISTMPPDAVSRKAHGNSAYSPLEQFLIALVWLRRGLSLITLADMCSIDESTIRAYRDATVELLSKKLFEKHVLMPTVPEWEASHSQAFKDRYPGVLMFFVDGTVVPKYQSQVIGTRKKDYNFKHKMPSFAFSIVVTEKGRIVWVSDLMDGNTNDATAWSSSGINDKLITNYAEFARAHPDLKFAICGDKAYPCIVIPEFFSVYVTSTAQETIGVVEQGPNGPLPPALQRANSDVPAEGQDIFQAPLGRGTKKADVNCRVLCSDVARWRAEVERVFRRIKCWLVTSNLAAMSGDPLIVQRYIHSIVAVENFEQACIQLAEVEPDQEIDECGPHE